MSTLALFRRRSDRPLSCREVGKLLQRYLDGHVDDRTAQRLEAHLDDCRRCGLEADTYERIKITLAAASHSGDAGSDEAVDRLREFGQRLARGEIDLGDPPSGHD